MKDAAITFALAAALLFGVVLSILLVLAFYGAFFGAIAAGAVWAFKAITAALGLL